MKEKTKMPKYANKRCQTCKETTSHILVDQIDGKQWQCEICGTFKGEN